VAVNRADTRALDDGGDLYALDPLRLRGEVDFEVNCKRARGGAGTRHSVVITGDWDVVTPHPDAELAAERVAIALAPKGTFVHTCVDLVDRVVPAVKRLVQLQSRRVLPDICFLPPRRANQTGFVADLLCRNACGGLGVELVPEAFKHVNTPQHVARTHRTSLEAVTRVQQALFGATALPRSDAQPGARSGAATCVTNLNALGFLWRAGVHPQLVTRLYHAVSRSDAPLPIAFYLGAVERRPPAAWLGSLAILGSPERIAAAVWDFGMQTTAAVVAAETEPEVARHAHKSCGAPRRLGTDSNISTNGEGGRGD
jgi:hypothetical protein